MVIHVLQEVLTLLKLSIGIFELVDHLSIPAHLFTQFLILCETGIISNAVSGLSQA